MIRNKKKTKVMLFNTAIVRNFIQVIRIHGEQVEIVKERKKKLGVKITSEFKWNVGTEHIVRMGFKKLWILRRPKAYGANRSELCDIYIKHVRSLLEYSAGVWHSALAELNRINI